MSERDAQDYAKELIRYAFFGSDAFHPDGGMISDRRRLERLRRVRPLLADFAQRVTHHEEKELSTRSGRIASQSWSNRSGKR